MIQIKDFDILENLMLRIYEPKLLEVLKWVYEEHKEMIITCGFRKGDSGVHGQEPCRGVDLRSTSFTNPKSVEEDINKYWEYDPTRPDMQVALLHNVGQGIHFHIQVHARTRRR